MYISVLFHITEIHYFQVDLDIICGIYLFTLVC